LKRLALFLILIVLASVSIAQEIADTKDKARFGLAQSLNNLGKFDQAAQELEVLYSRYPGNRNIAIELVKALGYGGNLDQAIQLLNNLEKRYPKDSEIKHLYATVFETNQKFEQAREYYVYLLEQKPADDMIKLKIADISSWIGDYSTSIDYYGQVLAKQPENIPLKTKLADVYFGAGNYIDAISFYNELGINPEVDKRRTENLGYSYLNIKQFEEAIDIFSRLLKYYPDDIEAKVALANTLYASGDIDKAREEFKKIIEQSPKDTRSAMKLAEILAAEQHYEEGISVCRQILLKEPHNKTAQLWLARILSWDKQYDESLKVYEDIIQADSDWLTPRREKARVLGWTRKYEKSIEEYQKVIANNPDDSVVIDEKKAKYGLYNYYDKQALKYYDRWLESEPDNLEALYDLGQIYSRQSKWEDAGKMYRRVLDIFPNHFMADQALKKVDIHSNNIKFKTGFEFFEADSGGRDIDKRYWNVFASLRKPLNEKYYLTLHQNNTWYDFSRLKQIYRQRFLIKLEYFNKPDFWASANYAHSIFSGQEGVRNTFGGEINLKPSDPWQVVLSHQRREIVDNSFTFENQLYRDDYKLRTIYRPERRVSLGGDYMRSNYSDGNIRDEYGFDVSYYLLYEPRSLRAIYRYEHYGFDRQDVTYFTPSSFHSHILGLQWKHFLNKEELFWGANDTFYTLGYETRFDYNSEHEVGHKIKVGFGHDWNNRCTSRIEWSKTVYETSSVYGENSLIFYTAFYF